MLKLEYRISIHAPASKVWKTLWDDATYRKWTAAFSETSYAVSDWQEGSKVLFLDESGSGMVSRIAEKRDNEYMSFEHLGMVDNKVEDTTSDKVKEWAGAKENYTLHATNGQTELVVETEITEKYASHFEEMWPKALAALKSLAETP